MTWFPHDSWRIFSLDIEFWGESSFLSVLGKHCVTSFWHARFLMRNPLSWKKQMHLWERCHFSLAGFKVFFSVVIFRSLVMMWLWIFLSLSCLGFASFPASVGWCIKFGEFSAFLAISIFVGMITRSRISG